MLIAAVVLVGWAVVGAVVGLVLGAAVRLGEADRAEHPLRY